jgi:hypothetical protein
MVRVVGDVEEECHKNIMIMLDILKYSIILDCKIEQDTEIILYHPLYINKLFDTISDEKIRDEFTIMFKHSTEKTLDALNEYPLIKRKMVKMLWLRPTF